MIKRLKAALRGSIKSLYLRYVWPSEVEGSEWSMENQLKAITLDHMEILGGALDLGCSLSSGGPMGQWLAGLVETLITAHDGITPPNYRQIELRLPVALDEQEREMVCLNIQRIERGRTPHEMRMAAERKLAETERLRMDAAAAATAYCIEVGELRSIVSHFARRMHMSVSYAAGQLNEAQRNIFTEVSGESPLASCPRCGSPDPHRFPASAMDGEVGECSDPFHRIITPQNTREQIAKRDELGLNKSNE